VSRASWGCSGVSRGAGVLGLSVGSTPLLSRPLRVRGSAGAAVASITAAPPPPPIPPPILCRGAPLPWPFRPARSRTRPRRPRLSRPVAAEEDVGPASSPAS
jgi:hypothetical protein